jgi:hypothetical protein
LSITHKEILTCVCGYQHIEMIVKSLNAGRHPHLRDQVLERTLHRFECPSCARRVVIDSDFFWFDFHRKEFIGVFPAGMRARAAECEKVLSSAFEFTMREYAPGFIKSYSEGFFVRTVFGVEELREKIVAHGAGLDDVVLEMVKLELFAVHPELIDRGVVSFRLDSFFDDGSLVLLPEAYDGELMGDPPIGIGARREIYDAIAPRRDELLRQHPAIVNGSHVSMRQLADAI